MCTWGLCGQEGPSTIPSTSHVANERYSSLGGREAEKKKFGGAIQILCHTYDVCGVRSPLGRQCQSATRHVSPEAVGVTRAPVISTLMVTFQPGDIFDHPRREYKWRVRSGTKSCKHQVFRGRVENEEGANPTRAPCEMIRSLRMKVTSTWTPWPFTATGWAA